MFFKLIPDHILVSQFPGTGAEAGRALLDRTADGRCPHMSITESMSQRQKVSTGFHDLAEFPFGALPRKVMDVSYFAETKGVVGCH
jgi:hypothetical protein